MPQMNPMLDELLLDVATTIELSDHDRRVAEGRYRQLKKHLERSSSPLAPYLEDGVSLIYPQGSAATATTVVSGTDDERFDLDAIVDFVVPPTWTPRQTLEILHEALLGFPGVKEIELCTRCVQLRFAFMHLDVTPLDQDVPLRAPRTGDICHAPTEGASLRIRANPFGFGEWFRDQMGANPAFGEALRKQRELYGVNRLENVGSTKAAEQDDLPDMIPPRLDTQRVVALKLLKRFVKLRYEHRDVRVPPSIYLAFFAGHASESEFGLFAQLLELSRAIGQDLGRHLSAGTHPDHRNPALGEDRINDRWPERASDMRLFAEDLRHFENALDAASTEDFEGIATILKELFGERVRERAVSAYLKRQTTDSSLGGSRHVAGVGTSLGASAVAAPAVARATRRTPDHAFHVDAADNHK